MMHKTVFAINDGVGGGNAFTDTGPVVTGALLQVHWDPIQADTGCDLALELMLTPNADTGDSIRFHNENDVMSASFTRCPRQPTHDVSGDPADTGGDFIEPLWFHGDRLKVRVTPGDTGHIEGTLRVWMRDFAP